MPEFNVTRFRSAAVALKELERYIRNGPHLQTGRAFTNFDHLRSRELLVNWLICAVANDSYGRERLQFCNDPEPEPCDGIFYDAETQEAYRTEHVMALPPREGTSRTADELILDAVAHKVDRGEAYATGKILVVFLNATTEPWYPNRIARALPQPIGFMQVWVVNLHSASEDDGYAYNVVQLDVSHGDAPAWRVHIANDFENWTVEVVQ
jgi:hypothetical protein